MAKFTLAAVKKIKIEGVDTTWVEKLVELVGADVAHFVLEVAVKAKARKVSKRGFSLNLLQSAVATMLATHRDEILEWVNNGEAVILDTLVALCGNRVLTLALTAYRDEVLAADDAALASALDQVIETLKE